MKRLTEEEIKEINSAVKDSWNQGIFKEPYGVDQEKGYVIYQRHETGGVSGGSCWDSSDPQEYYNDDRPEWECLDITLRKLCPDISYLQYKEIENLVKSDGDTDYEYYGNYTDFEFWWISLEDLYEFLEI